MLLRPEFGIETDLHWFWKSCFEQQMGQTLTRMSLPDCFRQPISRANSNIVFTFLEVKRTNLKFEHVKVVACPHVDCALQEFRHVFLHITKTLQLFSSTVLCNLVKVVLDWEETWLRKFFILDLISEVYKFKSPFMLHLVRSKSDKCVRWRMDINLLYVVWASSFNPLLGPTRSRVQVFSSHSGIVLSKDMNVLLKRSLDSPVMTCCPSSFQQCRGNQKKDTNARNVDFITWRRCVC